MVGQYIDSKKEDLPKNPVAVALVPVFRLWHESLPMFNEL